MPDVVGALGWRAAAFFLLILITCLAFDDIVGYSTLLVAEAELGLVDTVRAIRPLPMGCCELNVSFSLSFVLL